MAIAVGRLICTYKNAVGDPAAGNIVVRPINNATDGETVVVGTSMSFPLDENGELDVEVYVDDAEVTPDLYFEVTEKILGVYKPKPYIVKPEGAETNLATAQRYQIGDINPIVDPGEGVPGPPGQAATVSVGSTTTGAAGTNASVVNAGSTSAAILNFTIPRGAQGIQGIQGNPGTPGLPGEDGLDGEDGADGVDGTDTNYLWVPVVTGNEARPAVTHVFWVGGTEQPVNMQIGDVWLMEVAP